MAADLVAGAGNGAGKLRRLFQRHCGGGEGALEAVLRQEPHDPRRAGANAVEIVALVRVVADRNLQRDAELVDRLRTLVAGGDALLRPFLDIDHERHGEPLAARQGEAVGHLSGH
jgi:hypothetical protein